MSLKKPWIVVSSPREFAGIYNYRPAWLEDHDCVVRRFRTLEAAQYWWNENENLKPVDRRRPSTAVIHLDV